MYPSEVHAVFLWESVVNQNVELQVVLTQPKIAMLVMLTAIGMATDAVAKKIIDSSVKVNQVESKESTSKS